MVIAQPSPDLDHVRRVADQVIGHRNIQPPPCSGPPSRTARCFAWTTVKGSVVCSTTPLDRYARELLSRIRMSQVSMTSSDGKSYFDKSASPIKTPKSQRLLPNRSETSPALPIHRWQRVCEYVSQCFLIVQHDESALFLLFCFTKGVLYIIILLPH